MLFTPLETALRGKGGGAALPTLPIAAGDAVREGIIATGGVDGLESGRGILEGESDRSFFFSSISSVSAVAAAAAATAATALLFTPRETALRGKGGGAPPPTLPIAAGDAVLEGIVTTGGVDGLESGRGISEGESERSLESEVRKDERPGRAGREADEEEEEVLAWTGVSCAEGKVATEGGTVVVVEGTVVEGAGVEVEGTGVEAREVVCVFSVIALRDEAITGFRFLFGSGGGTEGIG